MKRREIINLAPFCSQKGKNKWHLKDFRNVKCKDAAPILLFQ